MWSFLFFWTNKKGIFFLRNMYHGVQMSETAFQVIWMGNIFFCSKNRHLKYAVTKTVLRYVRPQIRQMEDRLRSCEAQRELTALRRKLELVEEEKSEYGDKYSKAEVEVKDLRFTGEDIFGTVRTGWTVGHYTVHYRGSSVCVDYNNSNRPLWFKVWPWDSLHVFYQPGRPLAVH